MNRASELVISRVSALDAHNVVYRCGNKMFLVMKTVSRPAPTTFRACECDHLGRVIKGSPVKTLCEGVEAFVEAAVHLPKMFK